MTDKQKILQIEISNIVDKMTNGLMHPITGKQMLYESSIKALTLTDVSQQRKLLIAELNKTDLEYIHQQGCTDILAEDLLRAINCGITPVYGA